jgi:putative tryptophan/tyrosine transport system substrate-binding protein
MYFLYKRREFITLVGAGAAAWPLVASAQQYGRVRRVGILMGYAQNDPEGQARITAFLEALKALGWEDGRNLQIVLRWTSADVAQISRFAKELVASKPDLIVANTTPVTAAVHREAADIPIVFIIVSDPVGEGLVASLSHPGRNITGFINVENTIGGKWLQLLKEIAPATSQVAMMFNPDTAPGGGSYFLPAFETAGHALGIKAAAAPVRSDTEIENAIRSLARERDGGLVVMTDSYMTVHRRDIIRLSERERLPAVYPTSISAHDGGLISYAPDYYDVFRRGAGYVDRVLRGESASELPVQVPTKFELVINLKTAKALSLTVPDKLLAIADEVIE